MTTGATNNLISRDAAWMGDMGYGNGTMEWRTKKGQGGGYTAYGKQAITTLELPVLGAYVK